MTFFKIAKEMYKKGIFQFYIGAKLVFMGCIPAHAASFSVYEYLKNKFEINDDKLHPYLFGLTGAIATFSHDAIMTPLDVLK